MRSILHKPNGKGILRVICTNIDGRNTSPRNNKKNFIVGALILHRTHENIIEKVCTYFTHQPKQGRQAQRNLASIFYVVMNNEEQ